MCNLWRRIKNWISVSNSVWETGVQKKENCPGEAREGKKHGKQKSETRLTLEDFTVGESGRVKKRDINSVRAMACKYGKDSGKRFMTRRTSKNGYTIWRIK